jgi:hypothetical protein
MTYPENNLLATDFTNLHEKANPVQRVGFLISHLAILNSKLVLSLSKHPRESV